VVLSNPDYGELAVDLQPGDVVVFASDELVEAPARQVSRDVTEARPAVADDGIRSAAITGPSAIDAMFGFERLSRMAGDCAARARTAEAVADGIWAALKTWSGGEFGHDNLTLVVLRVK